MPPRDFFGRRRKKRREKEQDLIHDRPVSSLDPETEGLRNRVFELVPELTMEDIEIIAGAGIPGISFPEEGLLSDKLGEIIEDAANQGRAGDPLPNPQDFDFRGPDFNGNLEKPSFGANGPLSSSDSNGTPPHLLDPRTPSPLLVQLDPFGQYSPEQIANDIVTGAAASAGNGSVAHAGEAQARGVLGEDVQALGAQNANAVRHANARQLPPEELARLARVHSNDVQPPASGSFASPSWQDVGLLTSQQLVNAPIQKNRLTCRRNLHCQRVVVV